MVKEEPVIKEDTGVVEDVTEVEEPEVEVKEEPEVKEEHGEVEEKPRRVPAPEPRIVKEEVNDAELEEIQRKQEELERLEEELRKKEEELLRKQEEVELEIELENTYELELEDDEDVEVEEEENEVELSDSDPLETDLEPFEGTYPRDSENATETILGASEGNEELEEDLTEKELSLEEMMLEEIEGSGVITEYSGEDEFEQLEEPQPELSIAQRELLKQSVELSEEDILAEEEYNRQVQQQVTIEEELLGNINGSLVDVLPLKEGRRLETEINAKAEELRKKMKTKVREEQKEAERIEREEMQLRAEFAQMSEEESRKKKKRGLFGRKKGG